MSLTPATTILNGKYHILRLIGEGGMARVWLAEEPNFGNRPVAIKEPHIGLGSTDSEELRQRFLREVKVSAALAKAKTPNIVQALTAEPYEDGLLLVLDYMPGDDLETLIRDHPQGMPIERVVQIAQDVLKALAAVHEHPLDIVHRDIKPSNILFDGDGRARVGDFGLAQVAGWSEGRSQMMAGAHPGTPLYMAPEQEASAGYLTPAADIYAFGCVLFEMLTGQKYKRYRPGTRASEMRAETPAWLEQVLVKALAEDLWDRWQNGGEMLATLESGVDAECLAQAEAARQAELEQQRREQEAERRRQEEAARKLEEEKHRRAKAARQAELERQRREQEAERRRQAAEADRKRREGEAQTARQPGPPAAAPQSGGTSRWLVAIGFLLLGIVGTWWLAGGGRPEPTPVVEKVVEVTVEVTSTPDLATTPETNSSVSPAVLPTATPIPATATVVPPAGTSALGIGFTMISPVDGMEMVYVPAGEFLMGSPEGEGSDDEHPQHTVYLDAFWIDKTEVTNTMYQKCVAAGACSPNHDIGADLGGPQQPVVGVSWHDANAYCQWADRRLPTEAEWEKTARGTDGRTYPWGNEWDVASTRRLNFADKNTNYDWADKSADDGFQRTAPVGSYSSGACPYGALDMAGNVWEWVVDWYDSNYYASSPTRNPAGPDSGQSRVLRGGSWYYGQNFVRSAYRYVGYSPGYRLGDIGFRCAVPS